MWVRNTLLAAAVSASILGWVDKCDGQSYGIKSWDNTPALSEQVEVPDSTKVSDTEDTQKQIFVCLETDGPDSYTHTEVLESVTDPENTILEYPIDQLFKRYWDNKRPHPLAVSWVAKKFRSLLWRGWIEALDVPQKLNPRSEDITSETTYEIGDTLRFPLIDHRLKWAFPGNLSEQLKEKWFENFSDKDSLIINGIQPWELYENGRDSINQIDLLDNWYVYDIVVKSLPWWKSALALYRNWKLFMATYVSVWTSWRKTKRGQYEIIWKFPYKRSAKYDNAAMPLALNFYWWYYFHQRNVTGYPLSHGCIGNPWGYADVMYSVVLHEDHVDVFIDENLYESK